MSKHPATFTEITSILIISLIPLTTFSCADEKAQNTSASEPVQASPFSIMGKIRQIKNFTYDALGMKEYVSEKCNCVSKEEFDKMKLEMAQMIDEFPVFSNPEEEKEILDWQMTEWRQFGHDYHWENHKYQPYRNSVVMQRSARHRLYDHNIILAGLFDGLLTHKTRGDLAPLFKNALFVDIGSAILIEEGAPTVRDLYEDPKVESNLIAIIATDINEPGAEYIDTYTKSRQNLPFPVHRIPLRLNQVSHFQELTEKYIKKGTPIIFRSANSGPDLYYPPGDVRQHFRALIRAFYDRDVIYFFNKFILYKPAREMAFEKLGRDSGIGVDHMGVPWESIDWKNRRLQSAFLPNSDYITIKYE
jgi:hypothetical protein